MLCFILILFHSRYNAQPHPILFQIGGAPIMKSVSGPREDAVGTIVEDDEPIGDDLSEDEAKQETTSEDDLQEIKKYLKETPKKRKAAASGSRATSKKLKSKK